MKVLAKIIAIAGLRSRKRVHIQRGASGSLDALLAELLLEAVRASCLLVGFMPFGLKADFWTAPTTFEVYSKDSNYLAKIEPTERQRPLLSVFKVNGAERIPDWKVELGNQSCPVNVLLSDDGEHAVTLDEWHRVGYGENVIAFYNRKGLVRNYSLESAVASQPGGAGRTNLLSAFSHSVSSRWWRAKSILQFDGKGTDASFGIWLDWCARWFAWRLADGTPLKLGGEELRHWNEMGRSQARAWLWLPAISGRPSWEEMRQSTPAAKA